MSNKSVRGWAAAGAAMALVAGVFTGAGAATASTAPDDAAPVDGTSESVAALQVSSATQEIAIADGDVSIGLPGDATDAVVDTSALPEGLFRGTDGPVLSTTQDGSTLSSYPTAEGVQTIIQIPDAGAPAEYRFDVGVPEGGQLAAFDDGSVVVVDAEGAAVGGFRAPWAIDANGQAVPTAFHADGDQLVQTVEFTADTAFPVVADPDLGTEWWGYYVQLTRAETQQVATIIANNQGPASLAGVVCGALPAAPAVVACGVAIAAAYFNIIDPLNRANSAGKCAAINYPWIVLSNPGIGWTSINVTTVDCRR